MYAGAAVEGLQYILNQVNYINMSQQKAVFYCLFKLTTCES